MMETPVSGGTEHSLIKALRGVPDFDGLDNDELLTVVGCSVNLLWAKDSLIFEEGSHGAALFIVLAGRVQIFENVDGRENEIVVVQAGDYFGELSLLLDATHSKSARALEDTELLVIPKEPFEELMESSAELSGHLHRRLEERMPDAF